MDTIKKRDLIRFIGEYLMDHYRRKVIYVVPTYDLSKIDDDTDVREVIKETFIRPYERLIQEIRSLEKGDIVRATLEARYPQLEEEMLYVMKLIHGAITEYASLQKRGEAEKKLLFSLTVDKEQRAKAQQIIESLGAVKKNV